MIAWIGMGGNLGAVEERFGKAIVLLEQRGCRLLAASGLYRSRPVGPQDQPDFLNAVIRVAWAGTLGELLQELKAVERELGRVTRERWRERELDLDLLLAREQGWLQAQGGQLQVPHPRWRERAFVLLPLLELEPELRDPAGGRVAERLKDDGVRAQEVRLWKQEREWRPVI